MPRRLSVSNLYSQKFKFMPFTGEWKKILGNRERKGCWMIYGNAKNGKTSFALRLANYLSSIEKVLYIAAEEGYGYSYTWAVQKAGIREDNSAFHTLGYLPMEELRKELEENRKAEKIVFIDNLIAYKDELKGNAIVELLRQFPETLFVFLDHEEAGEPATSAGILAKKLSNVYVQIKGLSAFVTVRGGDGEGGRIDIDENKGKYSINSLVYWVTYVHNVVYSFYRSMIYCYINSTQRCAGSIVIDIIPTNGADKRKFFPFAPYFPVTNVIKRYFYPYFPAIIGIKGYSFPYFPYLSGIMKIKTALYSLFSRLDWHKTVVFPCLGEIYEGIRSLSWEIPVT